MGFTIRDFEECDYEGIAEAHTAAFPDMPVVAETYIEEDRTRDSRINYHRWVAVTDDGQVAGTGVHSQYLMQHHPQKFEIHVGVHPLHRGQGVGAALYDTIMGAVKEFDAISVRTQTREDQSVALGMLERRGFHETFRGGESHLSVFDFDPTPHEGLERRLAADGVVIHTLGQLECDPDRNRKLYDLHWEEKYRPPDAFFIAVDGERYVGMCLVLTNEADRSLDHGLTGVSKDYRNRGIAKVLKLRSIEWARVNDHPVIKTGNHTTNRPVLALNRQMGYVSQMDWIVFQKKLAGDATDSDTSVRQVPE